MKDHPFRICVWQIDGTARTYVQVEADPANRLIAELHSGLFFNQDRIVICSETEDSFLPPRVTRIDLITEETTVWDFPFAFGALTELPEAEFLDGVRSLHERPDLRTGARLFVDTETVSGQRTCLSMHIVAGFPEERMRQVYSLFKERQLIFGLREGGVGVLNLGNVARFAIHPEPVPINGVNGSNHSKNRKSDLRKACRSSGNGRAGPAASHRKDVMRVPVPRRLNAETTIETRE